MDRRMLRLPQVPITRFWSSGLVLLALLVVLAEIRHVRKSRQLSSELSGVETILTSQQLTYVAEPMGEPRRLPIELVDRGLPLALQESYAAQPSDYHPARTQQRDPSLLPPPAELPESQDDRANKPVNRESGESSSPILAPPDRSKPDMMPWSSERPLSSEEDAELDAIDDLMLLMPPAYPTTSRVNSPASPPSEVQLSYTSSDFEGRQLSQDGAAQPHTEVTRTIRSPFHQGKMPRFLRGDSPANAAQLSAAPSQPDRRLFPGPELEIRDEHARANQDEEIFWARTHWTRTVATPPARPQPATSGEESLRR